MSLEDKAQDAELQQWMINNAPRPAPVRYSPDDAGYGPEFCVKCDTEMPTARREHGFKLCTDCKSLQEQHDQQHAHKPSPRWLSR